MVISYAKRQLHSCWPHKIFIRPKDTLTLIKSKVYNLIKYVL